MRQQRWLAVWLENWPIQRRQASTGLGGTLHHGATPAETLAGQGSGEQDLGKQDPGGESGQLPLLLWDEDPRRGRLVMAACELCQRLGIRCEVQGEDLHVPTDQDLEVRMDLGGHIPKIDDGPWPAFPADLTSIALVVATQCRGTILIHEKMFESRMFFADKMIGMGARIVLCDPHRAVVVGPSRLYAGVMDSPDIRAGMALLIAALGAEGESHIYNIQQIERGYAAIDERLRRLGARISSEDSRGD
jgi:hypothetical protein